MSNLLVPAPSKGSDSVLFALGRPRNLGAFLPRLAQPDRDRLLATLDRGPAPPALQRPVLLLMHRALDRLLRGLSVSRHECFPPGCGVLSLTLLLSSKLLSRSWSDRARSPSCAPDARHASQSSCHNERSPLVPGPLCDIRGARAGTLCNAFHRNPQTTRASPVKRVHSTSGTVPANH